MKRFLNRGRSRSITRRTSRRVTRGRAAGTRDFQDTMLAFGRVLRARRRLEALAPEIFNVAVRERQNQQRQRNAKHDELMAAAMEKVYGPGSGAAYRRVADEGAAGAVPRRSARTERAIEYHVAERALWLGIAREAFARLIARPHQMLSLSQIARLIDVATCLGHGVTGLTAPARRPPVEEPGGLGFQAALARIYGPPEVTGPTG